MNEDDRINLNYDPIFKSYSGDDGHGNHFGTNFEMNSWSVDTADGYTGCGYTAKDALASAATQRRDRESK